MRTTPRTSSTTRTTLRGPVIALAAVALAVPISGLLGGVAFAGDNGSSAALKASTSPGNSDAAQAAKDARLAAGKPADFTGPVAPTSTSVSNANTTNVPFKNDGGVTTGSNTTKYEVVNGRSGSPAVGGGQPSGDVMAHQPLSTADQNGTGANNQAGNPYASTRDGAPSLNGNGGGKQVGQPCAGCVGKADNKNPPGQAPGPKDGNAGYECDRNHGIGRSNPAHTGCTTGDTTTPPPTTDLCPGTTMPVPPAGSGACPKPPTCKDGSAMPASGNANDCKPPVTCPADSTMVNGVCTVPAACPARSGTMVNGVCTVPAVCPSGSGTMVNGVCTVPAVCPTGTTTMPNGTCVLPISGTPGGPATGTGSGNGSGTGTNNGSGNGSGTGTNNGSGNGSGNGTGTGTVTGTTPGAPATGNGTGAVTGTTPSTPTEIASGTTPQAVQLPAVNHVTAPAAGTTAAPGGALPFTGSNTALLLQIAALMLLVGGGLALATRNQRPARAVV